MKEHQEGPFETGIDCCICNKEITDDQFGHNALPYKEGECCSHCNRTVVIPDRMKQMKD